MQMIELLDHKPSEYTIMFTDILSLEPDTFEFIVVRIHTVGNASE